MYVEDTMSHRPMLTQWPYVKNLVPHNSLYTYGRMQEVWLDK